MISMASMFEKNRSGMIEEGIRGGICHAAHRYAKANNEYMKDYDESKESSYIQYLDANNLYMVQLCLKNCQ